MAGRESSASPDSIELEAQVPYEEPYPHHNDELEPPAILRLTTSIDRFDHLAVFRRFGDLNILSILCLQAELLHLQSKLVLHTRESIAGRELKQNSDDGGIDLKPFLEVDGDQTPEFELLKKIRRKIVEYNAALQIYHQLKSYPRPQPFLLRLATRFFTYELPDWKLPDGTKVYDVRLKREFANVWSEENRYDLTCVTCERVTTNKLLRGLILLHGWVSHYLSARLSKIRGRGPKPTNDPKTQIQIERHSAFANRLIMALFGGASLIGPLLIMTLHPGLMTSHVTTCAATFMFALVLAIGAEETSGKDLLGATAAYAAVLVVFIGTSL